MRRTANDFFEWLQGQPKRKIGLRLLFAGIGSALVVRIVSEVPQAQYFWGSNAVCKPMYSGDLGLIERFSVWAFSFDMGVYLILALLGMGCLMLLSGALTRLAILLVLLCTSLLDSRCRFLLNGGDNISHLTLLYGLALLPLKSCKSYAKGSLSVWLHNVAVAAIIGQLIVMYLSSGFYKAQGESWTAGIAMYEISRVDEFSHPAFRAFWKNSFATTLASYGTMFFQLWFPIGIFSRFKIAFVVVGILFHLGIMINLGLVNFSLVMIGLELVVVTDEEYRRFMSWIQSMARGARLFRFGQS